MAPFQYVEILLEEENHKIDLKSHCNGIPGSLANIWRVATIIRFYCYCKITRPIVFPWRFWWFAHVEVFLWLLLVKKIFQMRQKSLEIKINRKFLTAVGIMQGLLHTAKSYKDKSQDNTQYSIILTRIIYCAKLLNRPSSCVLPKVHTELIPFQKVWII